MIVQSGTTPQSIAAANNLPDFVADYVVFDATLFKTRQRLIAGKTRYLAHGFWGAHWQ
ncbi:MAG: hypothetical protein IPJ88_16945 [Myxococcales bacterium]|nr:MAG: hypothetical protein IPJ88_16945 [Myxococcales bacterium]